MLGADQKGLEGAFGKSRTRKNFLDLERALGNIRCMFEQPDIARHQRGRDKTEDLPEGKIPRHDRENRTKRLIMDVALRGRSLNCFIGQKALCVLCIVAAGPCAFNRLLNCRTQRLPHFHRHQPPKLFFLALQNFSRVHHPASTLGEGEPLKTWENPSGTANLRIHLGIR